MAKSHLMGLVGDEDTCTAFLLGGIGELNDKREPNFLVVKKGRFLGSGSSFASSYFPYEPVTCRNKSLARKMCKILILKNAKPISYHFTCIQI